MIPAVSISGPHRLRRLLGAVLATVLAVASCSGGGDDDASGGDDVTTTTVFSSSVSVPTGSAISEGTAACALLTRAEVAAATGQAVDAGEGRQSEDENSSGCRWSTSTGDGGVAVVSGPGTSGQIPAQGGSTLSGVGDRGFLTDSAAYAVSGDTLVIVFLDLDVPPAQRRAAATDLIRKAVARL